MKSIIVDYKNGSKIYNSGYRYRTDENGETLDIKQTEEEQLQNCYESLIDDIRRDEFDKTMKALILGYLEWEQKDIENIKIVVEGLNGRHCEMNISVNINWDNATEIELPLLNEPTNKE